MKNKTSNSVTASLPLKLALTILLLAPIVSLHAGKAESQSSALPTAKASSSAGTNYGAEKAIDGDESTCWSPSQEEWLARKPMWLEVDLGQEREIGHAFITELAGGSYPHIQNFRIEYKQGDAWKCVYEARRFSDGGFMISSP